MSSPKPKATVLVEHYLKQLKLPTILPRVCQAGGGVSPGAG